MQRVEVETETLGDAGPPALDEHVGAPGERDERLVLRRVLQVEHDAALAPVVDRRRGGLLAAEGIAARRLHPHDVGAVVGQQPGGLRAGAAPGAIDDPQPFEDP